MSKLDYPKLQETLYREVLDNGLEVFVLPKPGFTKTYATFTTKYGSVDNHFRPEGQEARAVPDGIAHFLEHKMFEEPEGDVFRASPSRAHRPTRLRASTVRLIYFRRRENRSRAWIRCSISCRIRTSRTRTWKKKKALSSRKSTCTRTMRTGASTSA